MAASARSQRSRVVWGDALAFLIGVQALHLQPQLPAAPWWLALPLVLLGFSRRPPWRWPAVAAAGFFWAWLHAMLQLAQWPPSESEGVDVALSGRIASMPERMVGGIRFRFEPLQAPPGAHLPGPLRLAWYEPDAEPQPGELWRFVLRLRRPRGLSNPGGFDYEGWLFRAGFAGTGYVRGAAERLAAAGPLGYPLLRARSALAERIEATMPASPALGIVLALAVGSRHGIGPQQWEVLRVSGTAHLMAISGLHVGLVATLVFLLLRRLWSPRAAAATCLAATDAAVLGALCAALAYALLAGFAVPTRRALIMLAVVLGGLWLRRSLRPAHALSVALLAVLVVDPLAPLSAGFWLSFGAVTVLSLAAARQLGPPARATVLLRAQGALFLGLAPLMLGLFGRLSLAAPLVNLLFVPLFSLLVVPLVLVGVATLWPLPLVGEAALRLAAWCIERSWPLLELAAAHPASVLELAGLPVWTLAVAAAGTLLLLLPSAVPARYLVPLFWFPVLLWRPAPLAPGSVELTVLEVGQGLAAVVRTSRHTLVYDTGPSYRSGSDAASRALMPYLASLRLNRIDVLVLSHGDDDHSGGAGSLYEHVTVQRLLYGAGVTVPDRVSASPCEAGQHWSWDEVQFAMLWPTERGSGAANNGSCVLRIEAPGGSILLPGDIERWAEELLLKRLPELESDVVIAPHHGSRTSSTSAFVAATRPRLVLFSVGYRNRWGFPAPEVERRWRGAGAQTLDTAASGAIRVVIHPHGVREPVEWRRRARRYWHP